MKPKKTAEELVQMLHGEKGIQFHLISEEQAVECFSQRNNYLRTASYRKKLLTSWNQNDNISFVGALRSGQQPRAAIHNRSLITE